MGHTVSRNNTSTKRITTLARIMQTLRKRHIVQAMRNQWTWTMDHQIMEEEDIQIIIHVVHHEIQHIMMVHCMVHPMVLHMGLHMGHLLVIMAIMEVQTMVPGRMVREDKIMETMATVIEEETIKVISEVEEVEVDLNKTGKRIPAEETKKKAFPPSEVVYHVLIIFS